MKQKQEHRVFKTNILIFLIKPKFQGVRRLFILTFNANDSTIGHW